MDFCKAMIEEEGVIMLEDMDFPELGVLEKMGFLVSTEANDLILVRVNGYMLTEGGEHFFCVKEGKHE